MSEVLTNTHNTDSYYTNCAKVTRPKPTVAQGPNYMLQNKVVYSDREANEKMRSINNDIFETSQQIKKQESRKFWKSFIGLIIGLLGIVGLIKLGKNIFKKS